MSASAFPPAAGRKLVFLHLPKTGGTTLHHHFSQAFAPEEICPERFSRLDRFTTEELGRFRYFSGHFNYEQLRMIPGPLFTVTVMRDPVERILSTYYFWKRHRPEYVERQRLAGPAAARSSGNLLDFLRNTTPEVLDAIDNTMSRYLAGHVNVAPDHSYRFSAAGAGIPMSELEIMHRASGNLMAMDVFGFTSNLVEVFTRVALVFGMKRTSSLVRLNTRGDVNELLEPTTEEPITPDIRAELNRLTSVDREIFRLGRLHWKLARR
ncbi:sulfotransferase family protein [Roseomonas sp. HJA6]|uniref:Sulfotransferase family protein n=1 Tax=Roseomonas alba TaxID=2846776 RepID=A0ABS7ABN8_9PROT|nr:sulfotransferase family 2 domain-containing protein [Neoroseomonas alba]MBW6399510.1 sulfotransferase family protein [Neoroseomonas alba]